MRIHEKGPKKGFYHPINPSKWNTDKIPYLSNWERQVFYKLDINPIITKIAANSMIIPYICATDKREHRYYMDVFYEQVHNDKKEYFMIEVKPDEQLLPPNPPKKQTASAIRSYKYKILQFQKNMSKWISAERLAVNRGWTFIIMTEKFYYAFKNNILQQITKNDLF